VHHDVDSNRCASGSVQRKGAEHYQSPMDVTRLLPQVRLPEVRRIKFLNFQGGSRMISNHKGLNPQLSSYLPYLESFPLVIQWLSYLRSGLIQLRQKDGGSSRLRECFLQWKDEVRTRNFASECFP
jgi:hypothetical protein